MIGKNARTPDGMKTLIEVHREGKYYVAIDLLTHVADQGLTGEEAVRNLKKGLTEYHQLKRALLNQKE